LCSDEGIELNVTDRRKIVFLGQCESSPFCDSLRTDYDVTSCTSLDKARELLHSKEAPVLIVEDLTEGSGKDFSIYLDILETFSDGLAILSDD